MKKILILISISILFVGCENIVTKKESIENKKEVNLKKDPILDNLPEKREINFSKEEINSIMKEEKTK